ncbi:hypothetical protein CAT7_03904 [Carnobacterium sp. AT7]|uniref:DUF1129 domain-containing protein n=1 Tax=Carnobacterium TaxID=2747 RepID=UPI00015F36CF|nr:MULTISPECIES: DUF1129 family protein [Carnobacterium]EDP67624.1 hypothetical protein CAT7_03904 [Carnobacterium sp. AT7]
MEETQVSSTQIKKEENSVLFQKLTKKNEQYMLSLNKTLIEKNMSETKKEDIFNEMLKKLVERQKTGETARQLYGTVTECANQLIDQPEKVQTGPSENWKIALDGGLMIGGLFSLITGLSGLFSNVEETASALGIITTLLNFIVGGLVILWISKNMPDRKNPKKGGMFRYILVSTIGMLSLMVVMTGSMMVIPSAVNVPINAIGNIVVGVLAFVAKYFAKRKLNIRGGLF